MGQKTNPIGNRLGIIRGWESNWYGGNDYGDKLAEDDKIRRYVHARLAKASVSRVIIERTLKLVTITITTAATANAMTDTVRCRRTPRYRHLRRTSAEHHNLTRSSRRRLRSTLHNATERTNTT